MDFLTSLEADAHPLLESRSPAYTHATVRRAFIVWLRCGQKNEFRDVCNYYHYLEAMEDQLPADARASSRHLEFSLFVSEPPTSPYQQRLFPQLYSPSLDHQPFSQPHIQNYQIAAPVKAEDLQVAVAPKEILKSGVSPQEIFDASQVFKTPAENVVKKVEIDTFLKFIGHDHKKEAESKQSVIAKTNKVQDKLNGTSKQDILETSQMIKNYCKDQQVPLRNFLEHFKEYATRCELSNTVNNVGSYIKRKMIHSELTLAVLVHRAKYNTGRSITKSPPKLADFQTNEDFNNKSQTELRATLSDLKINDDTDVKNAQAEANSAKLKKLNAFNDDLIKLDDKVSKDQTANNIKLLRREHGLKTTAGFSNSHNIVKLDTLKCRKI